MPFRTRPTELEPGKGPASVDFDALWERAIFPALDELKYMPIRADHQTGSVIVKDMLDQLVYADLVLADISVANGNVYYEAGVRHAARAKGCILIGAEWAKPLFDLDQIRQLRYALDTDQPEQADYDAIRDRLVETIPGLAEQEGPVFALTHHAEAATPDSHESRHLREVSSRIFHFQTRLRTAKVEADNGNKTALRELMKPSHVDGLPGYALEELVEAVRDHLNWKELLSLLDRLPASVQSDPYFIEQRVIALANVGRVTDAIGKMEALNSTHGETPDRLGTIGGRYRELADQAVEEGQKRKYRKKAIEAYRRGMLLDLNQYYCAHKLLVVLLERDRLNDRAEAEACAAHVKAACERARKLDRRDEWLEPTELIHAFFVQDVDTARRLAEEVLDRDWANWKLLGLVRDLEAVLTGVSAPEDSPLRRIFEELRRPLPKSQAELMRVVLPLILEKGRHYEKFQQVDARPAEPGEIVISRTSSGEETSNRAGANDMLVRNLTHAREQYLVGVDKFRARYQKLEDLDDGWVRYEPIGEVRAIEIDHDLTTRIGVGTRFYIMAPWGTEQLVCEGNYLVTPVPTQDEIYRIDTSEFNETYREVDDQRATRGE